MVDNRAGIGHNLSMKKACLLILCALLWVSATAAAAEKVALVASRYSDRYHLASCKIAKKILPDDLMKFDSPEEAVAAGLVPCRKCNPPTQSKPSLK
jgi:methylphosphotriester-DNA--protein-cysteine methyltransferase